MEEDIDKKVTMTLHGKQRQMDQQKWLVRSLSMMRDDCSLEAVRQLNWE